MKKLNLTTATILATALLLTSCGGSKQEEITVDELPQVRVETLKKEPVEQSRDFTGTVQSFKQNDITPSMPVRIDNILVDVGDNVKKGQVLVEMDVVNRQQLQLQLANLERELERVTELHKTGGISQQQVDQLTVQVNIQRTAMQNMIENTTLRAPFDGVVTGRYYHPGEMFSMSPTASGRAAILTVMTLAPLKVTIHVNEEYFSRVKAGVKVDVTTDIYPGVSFRGAVHIVHPTIDPMTRTFGVEVQIPNSDLRLRPGMFARVNVNFGSMERVVAPDLAIIRQTGTNDRYVFVYENGIVHKVKVQVGRQVGNRVEILDGLNEGDQVVVAGMARLLDQSKVRIVE
ncbi:MAG: efflux RND transporter periplasmic adaptor subunit [Bacteroidales bacterium]|nr:efflux RND transporter periplasmic adaptor subunit [Bacteroidales bacterium]